MTRPAFYWIVGAITGIVATAIGGNPIVGIIGAILSGLLIDQLEKRL